MRLGRKGSVGLADAEEGLDPMSPEGLVDARLQAWGRAEDGDTPAPASLEDNGHELLHGLSMNGHDGHHEPLLVVDDGGVDPGAVWSDPDVDEAEPEADGGPEEADEVFVAVAPVEAEQPGMVSSVGLHDIVMMDGQPRTRIDYDQLVELAQSIKLHGVIQPLVVAPADTDGKHPLIAGSRRWQAAELAGLETVPVIERVVEGPASLALALVENLQREDLDPLEEAAAFDMLVRDHGFTQEQVADQVGRSRSAVANALRLLKLAPPVRDALGEGRISEGHARALLGVEDLSKAEDLLEAVTSQKLTVRQTESLVTKGRKDRNLPTPAVSERAAEIQTMEEQLTEAFETKVSIADGRQGGRIAIEYASPDHLAALVQRLLSPCPEASQPAEG